MDHERDVVAAMKMALAELPEPSRNKISTRDAIAEMADTINELRTRGYTLADVAQLLTERGMRVAANTLRAYLRSRRGRSRSKPRHGGGAVGRDGNAAGVEIKAASAGEMPAQTRGAQNVTGAPGKAQVAGDETRAAPALRRGFALRPDDDDL
jgi:hypothetical protein